MPMEKMTLTAAELELIKHCMSVAAELFRADATAMKAVQSVRLSSAFSMQASQAHELIEKLESFEVAVLFNGDQT